MVGIPNLLVGLYSVANSPSSNRDVCALNVWLPFVWNHGPPPSLYSLFYKSKRLSTHEQLLTFRNSTAMRLLHSALGTFSTTVYKSPSACNILQTRLLALLFIYPPCIPLYLFIYLFIIVGHWRFVFLMLWSGGHSLMPPLRISRWSFV